MASVSFRGAEGATGVAVVAVKAVKQKGREVTIRLGVLLPLPPPVRGTTGRSRSGSWEKACLAADFWLASCCSCVFWLSGGSVCSCGCSYMYAFVPVAILAQIRAPPPAAPRGTRPAGAIGDERRGARRCPAAAKEEEEEEGWERPPGHDGDHRHVHCVQARLASGTRLQRPRSFAKRSRRAAWP
jgi:hypothetical protein